MGKVRILEIKESVFADNDRQADQLRIRLKEKGVFLMNLMSSPGSGKTTTLKRTIAALKDDLRIGVMEADIDSDVDALAIAETGAKAIQLHTGGMCQTRPDRQDFLRFRESPDLHLQCPDLRSPALSFLHPKM